MKVWCIMDRWSLKATGVFNASVVLRQMEWVAVVVLIFIPRGYLNYDDGRRWNTRRAAPSLISFAVDSQRWRKAKLDSIKHLYLPKRPDFTWSWSPCLIRQVTVWFEIMGRFFARAIITIIFCSCHTGRRIKHTSFNWSKCSPQAKDRVQEA